MKYLFCIFLLLSVFTASYCLAVEPDDGDLPPITSVITKPAPAQHFLTLYWEHRSKNTLNFLLDRIQCSSFSIRILVESSRNDNYPAYLEERLLFEDCMRQFDWHTPTPFFPVEQMNRTVFTDEYLPMDNTIRTTLYTLATDECQQTTKNMESQEARERQFTHCMETRGWYHPLEELLR